MSSWSFKNLREYINTDETQKELNLELLNSIGRAIEIYRYHHDLARNANDSIKPSGLKEAINLVMPPEDTREEVWHGKITIQANTQAAVHSARAINDIFSQLLNSLLLSRSIPIHSCDIAKATNALPDSTLKSHLEDMLKSEEYLYINALVNTIKHRNLVSFGAQVNFETEESGIQFRAFKYREVTYGPLWAEQVLRYALAVKNSVITAGSILNKQLGIDSN